MRYGRSSGEAGRYLTASCVAAFCVLDFDSQTELFSLCEGWYYLRTIVGRNIAELGKANPYSQEVNYEKFL